MPSAPAAPDDDDARMDVVAAEGGDGERFAVQAQDVLQPLCARLAAVPAGRRAPLVSMAMQVPLFPTPTPGPGPGHLHPAPTIGADPAPTQSLV